MKTKNQTKSKNQTDAKKPLTKDQQAINHKRQGKLIFALAIGIISLFFISVIAIASYFVWQANITHTITIVAMDGISFSTPLENKVKNKKEFSFTFHLHDDIVPYPTLSSVTANGKKLLAKEGVFVIENVTKNIEILISGYGTSGLIINDTTVEEGVDLEKIVIPYGINKIEAHAFTSFPNLTELYLPTTIKTIESGAFENCTNLNKISGTNQLHYVGKNAFSNTEWLQSQPNGVVYMGKNAYSYSGEMPKSFSLNINDGTLSITESAFENQSNLVALTLPQSVKIIESEAFINCEGLLDITIGDCVEKIGKDSFLNTAWLKSKPAGIVYLNNWCYGALGSLESGSAIIDDSAIGIASHAFEYHSGLSFVVLPSNLKHIGTYAFNYTNFAHLPLPETLISIGEHAFANSGLVRITLPNSVETIGNHAFMNSQLDSITLGNSLKNLDDGVFLDCQNLKTITINSQLTHIHTSAFENCENIEIITIHSETPAKIVSTNLLADASENLQIFVPATALDDYKNMSGWNSVRDKIFAIA